MHWPHFSGPAEAAEFEVIISAATFLKSYSPFDLITMIARLLEDTSEEPGYFPYRLLNLFERASKVDQLFTQEPALSAHTVLKEKVEKLAAHSSSSAR